MFNERVNVECVVVSNNGHSLNIVLKYLSKS